MKVLLNRQYIAYNLYEMKLTRQGTMLVHFSATRLHCILPPGLMMPFGAISVNRAVMLISKSSIFFKRVEYNNTITTAKFYDIFTVSYKKVLLIK